jgi:hypothetical protein
MTKYPILFSRRDLVKSSHGYMAGVIVAGRILVSDEGGQFWAEGVNPGGFAEKGESVEAALNAVCNSYHEVLLDIAEDEPSFERFQNAVERFFADTNLVAQAAWEAAVREVRAGKVNLESMRKRPSEAPTGIKVLLLEGKEKKEGEQVSDAAMAA